MANGQLRDDSRNRKKSPAEILKKRYEKRQYWQKRTWGKEKGIDQAHFPEKPVAYMAKVEFA